MDHPKRKEFSEFVQTVKTGTKGTGAAAFGSLAITVVQRMPRYEMLLKEVIKRTQDTTESNFLNNTLQMLIAGIQMINQTNALWQSHDFVEIVTEDNEQPIKLGCDYCGKKIRGKPQTCSNCGLCAHKRCAFENSGFTDCPVQPGSFIQRIQLI